jgi:uncharacterized SAM-binding protein YcdF (DUF218 family)
MISFFMLILSFTSWPYHAYHWTGYFDNHDNKSAPQTIILMGAGGFPGSESLIRSYYTAVAAHDFPEAQIIIAFPADSLNFEESDHFLMFKELQQRGIDSSRIKSEINGYNTYSQAVNISKMIPADHSLLLITSPVHTYRSIKTFENQGFKNVRAQGTTEGYTEVDLFLSKADRDNKIKSPDANPSLRYNIWSFLQYEIAVLREWTAIAWYKLKGYM